MGNGHHTYQLLLLCTENEIFGTFYIKIALSVYLVCTCLCVTVEPGPNYVSSYVLPLFTPPVN